MPIRYKELKGARMRLVLKTSWGQQNLRPYEKVGSSKPTLDRSAVRLIRPDEAVEHIGLLLANEQIDLKQRLLFIASVAIAGMIGLEGDSIEVERIDGLQQGVNRMLFINGES